jgi:hypothetical protein
MKIQTSVIPSPPKKEKKLLEDIICPGVVAHSYKLSYLGGGDWGDCGSKLALGKNVQPYRKNN